MRTTLRAIAIIFVSLAVIGAIIIFVGPLFISTKVVRDQAFAKIEDATGYRLRVSGTVRMSIFPSLDLVTEDIGIAQPQAGGAVEFATARALRLGLRLGPLLKGKVQITEMTLVDPKIALPLPSRAASMAADDTETEPAETLQNLTLDQLHIVNGTVILPNSEGRPGKPIVGLTLDATLPQASGDISFKASGDYNGDRMRAQGSIGKFARFLEGGPATVELAIEAPDVVPAGATLSGTATYRDGVLTLAQFAAQSGPRRLAGYATYSNDTLTVADGMFDGVPFSGAAKLAGDTLTADVRAMVEGDAVRVAGTFGNFDQFLKGGSAPIRVAIAAPSALPAGATLSGTASYQDDTFTLAEFTAESGDHALSGTATYKDDALWLSGLTAQTGDRTVTGGATYKSDAISLDLTLSLKEKRVRLTGYVTGVAGLLKGEPGPLNLGIEAPDYLPAKASLVGRVAFANDTLTLTEFVTVSGGYKLTGNGTYQRETLTLDPVVAEVNGQKVSGAIAANLAQAIPNIAGSLTVTSTKNMGGPSHTASPETKDESTSEARAKPETAKNQLASHPESETTLATRPPATGESAKVPASPPKDSAAAADGPGADWSDDNLVLLLATVNGSLNLTLNQFVHDGIKIDAANVKATLSGGKLTAEFTDLKGYGGSGSGSLAVDASGEVPTQRLVLSLANVDAYPFLNSLTGSQTVKGKATVGLDLAASGESERAIVSSLNGTAKFEFTDGALLGLNIAKMLRSLTLGVLTGWQFNEEAKTVFSKLGASFTVANGQAQTDDLRMIGPLVSVGGAGTVDLPSETLKFRVNPLMLASVDGGDGKMSRLGFPVPIAVSGPWDRPFFYPDIAGILENPVAAYQQLNKLGGGLIAVPAGILGIDTGKGGLVEKGIALPGAITKGVVGGIGQALGTKKQGTAEATSAAPTPAQQDATASPAVEEAATEAAVVPPADAQSGEAWAPLSSDAHQQEPTAKAEPQKKPAADNADSPMMQNLFTR